MQTTYTIKGIYEDDFGCEERSPEQELQVLVVLQDDSGMERTLRQPDAWLYEQMIEEGDTVLLMDGLLRKWEEKAKKVETSA